MITNRNKEIIEKQYEGAYFGYDIFKCKTLEELDKIYQEVESSRYSKEIKKKIFNKIKIRIKYLRLPKSLKKKLSYLLNKPRVNY